MKKTILALVAALILTLAPVALAAVNVVSPTDDFYVNDAAGVLSNETKGHIVLNNDALNEACGAQIVVVTVDSVGGATMEEYASALFDEWNIGSSEKNNGLLLVMSIDDDDYWMTEGKGLRSAITAGDIGELLDTYLEPYFDKKDYDGGAKALFDAAFAAVCKAEGLSLKVDQNAYASYLAENGGDEPEEPVSEPVRTSSEVPARTTTSAPASSGSGSGIAGLVILVIVAIVVIMVIRGSRRKSATTYNTYNTYTTTGTTRYDNSASSYRRGFFMGSLLGRGTRRTPPPPPPVQTPPAYTPPPTGRTNTATRPSAGRPATPPPASRPSSGGSIFGSGSSSRSTTTSRPSSGGSIFGSGRSSSSSSSSSHSSGSVFGSGRSSSSRSSFSSGRSSFGGGRSGGGGASRGGGAGRHR